ncbi:N-acetylmuramoyl-L-alanine amidase [Listeria cossartiae subsp. cayugensis]|uniref:N-acetylmuramoyl-L-alanine amidase n=1 Tax=Listeria cossartiae TaxID=2838249 RepID=UPI0028807765|nr:N-acetylmuramoyl-L-alanine amidase [Listeria cossartiae]MDT0003143.1 N-acetylmuramoyl-L-alanine amidase [Listeria cossartiae subsp. cayugensis]MDT0018489.1 N-acetylmuramoyl-L-alanine amidase [Listeria cossartiae subsp. cayugensis]MDT0035938.1 N-acetylmuramoyl-L-alanine amidase [Listeria cossartiae subsp. cayugensis]MDT0040239.1 N-acetylmuramoyl-L-alanine amidase [Listeria cossartiae subsp. cayugensis]MDT0046640.1 N-acetylmuramoyl-L-alanine amidase [Listeria cossartiae subsp. cayugensis]
MKNKFIFITVVSILLIAAGIFTTIAMANANSVVVKAEVLNVRSGPGLAYDVTSQARKNEVLRVVGEENQWYKVQLDNGNSGWVASWLVENTDVSAASNSVAIVSSDGGLNVREKPSTASNSLGLLNKGDQVTVTSQQNGWAQIQYNGKSAWVSSDYLTIRESVTKVDESELQTVTIRDDSTNIRNKPSRDGTVIEKANSGQGFAIQGVQGDWYKIRTTSGEEGYVANWVVDVSDKGQTSSPRSKTTKLSEATIVIDPGHGGNDPGAKGANGTIEKEMTLKTAKQLKEKLESRGAKVILTRNSDKYISLKARTSVAAKNNADVFISIHFDSLEDTSKAVSGQTTYYYDNSDKSLAESINTTLGNDLPTSNRGSRVGDYYVVRENSQPAVLLELGYLSSAKDERNINSASYRSQIADSVTDGLSNYFSN